MLSRFLEVLEVLMVLGGYGTSACDPMIERFYRCHIWAFQNVFVLQNNAISYRHFKGLQLEIVAFAKTRLREGEESQ